jgi:tellurite resistance protein TehA-like permease
MVRMTGGGADQQRARPPRRAFSAIRGLHAVSFAFVMATGIISEGTFLVGPSWLSRVLLVVAAAGLAGLAVAFLIRLAVFPADVAADAKAPERVFGFFAIVAAADVLAARLAAAGHPVATAVLAGLAAAVWLVLSYGVPVSLLLARDRDSVLGSVDGAWLLWGVGATSLAVVAATLVPAWPSQSVLLASAAAGLWGVGVLLYLLLVAVILLRWLTVPLTPAGVGPSYWILMGATAISVLAGTRILDLPARLAVVRATAEFIKGFSFTLWAFGTWWLPLLIVLGVWRHVRQHWPLSYEPGLWSVVFPLGMYSVATLSLGKTERIGFMAPLGRFMLWVALASCVLVAAAFVARLAHPRSAAHQPTAAPSPRVGGFS